MPSANSRIGVVGASGFIGRALVANIVADGRGCPRLFGRSAGTVAGCPVEPLALTSETFAGLECVVHLAGITDSNASLEELQRTNVDLPVGVIRAAAAAQVKRLVFLSSLGVHGKAAAHAILPDSPLHSDNPYGRSKIDAERQLGVVAAESGIELVILRPPMVYGRSSTGSFAALARLVGTGAPLPFQLARGRRTFCSVNNLICAIRHVVDAEQPAGILIPGDAEDFDTPGLVEAIAAALGRRARLWPVPPGVVAGLLGLAGRGEIAASLFKSMRVDRSHWDLQGWSPVESSWEAVQKALGPDRDAGALALYITSSAPYFFSHRIGVAREAASRGFRVALAGSDVNEHLIQLRAEAVQPLSIPGLARGVDPLGDIRAAAAIAGHIRRESPAIIQAAGLKTIFLCALAALMVPLPRAVCIVTGLGSTYINDTPKTRLMRRGIEAVLRPLLRRALTTVVFQNADDRAYFLERGVATAGNSLIIKGSGVDTKEFTQTPEPVGDPVVVFPARLLKSKGVCEFAEAAAILTARGVKARFVLVGDLDPANPDALTKGELADLVAAGAVETWGFRTDMVAVLAGCHLVCLPSYREGVPKALIEAASVGRAIVATDVPGCREIVREGENGLLVPARDAGALAGALQTLIEDPALRRRMGVAGRALVEAEFSMKAVVNATVDLYGSPNRTPLAAA